MRFCLIIIITTFLIINSSYSQVNIGVLGGLNSRYDDVQKFFLRNANAYLATETSSILGFGIGGVIEIELNNNFGLKLEPMYLTKGTYYKIGNLDEIKVERGFFEIPLILIYKFSGNIRPYILSGISLGMILYENHGSLEKLTEDSDLELSLLLGGGLSYRPYLSPFEFFVEAKYDLGLTRINSLYFMGLDSSGTYEASIDSERVNHGFSIFIGTTFSLNY